MQQFCGFDMRARSNGAIQYRVQQPPSHCQYVIEDELENIILKLNAKTADDLHLISISTCLIKKNVHQNILQPLTTD